MDFCAFFGINWALGTALCGTMKPTTFFIIIISYFKYALNILGLFFRYRLVKNDKEQANRELKWTNDEENGDKCTVKWFVSFSVQNVGRIHKKLINIKIQNTQKSEQISMVDTKYSRRFWVCIALYVLLYLLLLVRKTVAHRICICMNILNGFRSFVCWMFVMCEFHLILSLFTFDEHETRILHSIRVQVERKDRHDTIAYCSIEFI